MEKLNAIQLLNKIQQEISVPKDMYNKFGEFYYRNAESILSALKPLLKDHDAVILLSDDLVEITGKVYIKGTATLRVDYDGSNDQVSVSSYAREEEERPKMSPGQLTGSASTYARKYALNGLLGLDDAEDPDSKKNEVKSKPANKPVVEKPVYQQAPKTTVTKTVAKKSNLPMSFWVFKKDDVLDIGDKKYKVMRGPGKKNPNIEYFGLKELGSNPEKVHWHSSNNPVVEQLISQFNDENNVDPDDLPF